MKIQQNFCRRHLALIPFTAALALHLHGWAATFVVTSTADSGPGSLRQAVEDSNWFLGSNNIVIATFGTIDLAGGELLITNNANIVGPGAALLRVDANYSSRVFHIVNAAVTISDLTITRGSNSLGGGLLQEFGALNLNRCAVIQNRAVNGGGLAQAEGTMHIADSTISSNSAAGTAWAFISRAAPPRPSDEAPSPQMWVWAALDPAAASLIPVQR
jgi:hypothetical protein